MDFSGSSGHIVHHQKGIPAGTARRPSTSSMGVLRQIDSEQANFRVARHSGAIPASRRRISVRAVSSASYRGSTALLGVCREYVSTSLALRLEIH